jgi:outer membrane protein with beta-barrel domain
MKILTHCLFIFLFTLIVSSHCDAQARVGLFAGSQTTTANYTVNGATQPTKSKFGIHGGMGMKVPFEGHLYFYPSLSYYQFGYDVTFNKQSIPPDSFAVDNSVSIHQVNIDPVLQFDITKNPSHFYIRLGPSFQVLISGKEKFNKSSGDPVDRKMALGLYEDYGRMLVSIVPAAGYETASGFFFNFQYSLGLTSINNADGGPRILERMAGLSVGYFLKNKKIVIDTRNKE